VAAPEPYDVGRALAITTASTSLDLDGKLE
jgi:hypothetical protein